MPRSPRAAIRSAPHGLPLDDGSWLGGGEEHPTRAATPPSRCCATCSIRPPIAAPAAPPPCPFPTFGKTGTTSDYRDALFVGFAGDLVVGVWIGNDDNTPLPGTAGGGLPARIWRAFMVEALGDAARGRPGHPAVRGRSGARRRNVAGNAVEPQPVPGETPPGPEAPPPPEVIAPPPPPPKEEPAPDA